MTTTSSTSSLDALTTALNSLTSATSSGTSSASTTSTTGTSKGVGGLASGIDTKALVDAMIQSDRVTTAQIEARMAQFQKRKDTVQSLNTKLLSAQLDLSNLKLSGTLNARTVTSSDDAIATATANSSSSIGSTFSGTVTGIAKAHQLATAGMASASTSLGAGSITLKVGAGASKTIAIDAATSSLSDIAKAINNAGAGVTASVVNQSGTNPYRLVLTSNSTGADNAISISADSGNSALASLFSGASTITAASNAALTIGSGAGAITLTSASNTFADVAPGVSLTVKKLGDVSVTVGTDTTKAKDGITAFIKDLNAALTFMKDNSSYDSDTQTAGVLIQESDLRDGVNQLARSLIASIPGLPSTMNNATQLGITFDYTTGTFSLDESTLDNALANDPTGVQNLFQNTGSSTSTGVSFGTLTGKTKTSVPFQVNITQAAAQAGLGASSSLSASTVIDTSNNKLSLTVNGSSYTATLTAGTYSQSGLVEHIQLGLAAATAASPSSRVIASLDSSGQLALTTKGYGSSMSLSLDAGSTATAILGLTAGANATGKDVRGTINGVAGVGTGQILDAASGSDAEGLSLVVTASAPISNVSVTARKGLSQTLQERFSKLTDIDTGLAPLKTSSYTTIITDQKARITQNDARLAERRKYYEAKFTQMETLTAKYQSLSTYLTQFSSSSSSS